MRSARSTKPAVIGLLAVAVSWGTTFPLSKALFRRLGVWDLLAVRFSIAAIVMVVLFLPAIRRLSRRTLVRGVALGVAYGAAQILANLGLERAPAGVAGFITGTYVVLTPVCAAVILGSRLGARAWSGAGIALTGLGVLALHGLSIGTGEALTLVAALVYALHIIGLGVLSTARDAVGLAAVQIVVTALVCVVAALVRNGRVDLPRDGYDWSVIIYMALVSGALAMIMQSWAQAHLPPSRVAIIMATEPVWAAGLSVLFLAEPFTWRLGLGGGLILAALVLVETGPPGGRVRPRRPTSTKRRGLGSTAR